MIKTNLFKRIVTAFLIVPPVLYIIYWGGLPFLALLIFAAAVMGMEWQHITKSEHPILQAIGAMMIMLPIISLWFIREDSLKFTIWLFLTIWITDIAAYFSGRLIGGAKLAPKISPKKTWAGLIGALLFTAIFGYHFGEGSYILALLSSIIAFFAQMGDLTESYLKRKYEVKDSGNMLPGHGGILDRVDGFLFAAPLALLFKILGII